MDDQESFSEEFLKEAGEKVGEELLEAARKETLKIILKQFTPHLLSGLRALHGHPYHGLRTTLLERLRQKYPRLSFGTLDRLLKEVIEPSCYARLTD